MELKKSLTINNFKSAPIDDFFNVQDDTYISLSTTFFLVFVIQEYEFSYVIMHTLPFWVSTLAVSFIMLLSVVLYTDCYYINCIQYEDVFSSLTCNFVAVH